MDQQLVERSCNITISPLIFEGVFTNAKTVRTSGSALFYYYYFLYCIEAFFYKNIFYKNYESVDLSFLGRVSYPN